MKKNIEYQTWVNKAHPRPKVFIAAFPHAFPPALSAQKLLFPISASSQETQVLVCQNSVQT